MSIIPKTFASVFSFSVRTGILVAFFTLYQSANTAVAREDGAEPKTEIAPPAPKAEVASSPESAAPAPVATPAAAPAATPSAQAPAVAPSVPAPEPAKVEAPKPAAVEKPAPVAKKKIPAPKASEPIQNQMNIPESNVSLDLPPIETIATDLGYKPQEFKKYVDDFASSLSAGPHSAAYHRLCARDEETCLLVKDFHNQEWSAKADRRRSRQRIKRFRITESNISQAQRFDFRVLVTSLKTEEESKLYQLAELSLKETQCPRNLSSALSVKAEEYFPSSKARTISKELFEHARHCIQLDDFAYERLFLRQALFAYYDNDKQKSREYLVAAKQAKNNTERYRVLYWLGRLANESGVKGSDNSDWKELMNEYPLSYYAIQAAVTLKQDPLEMITQRKLSGLKREASDDPELNRMIRWLEALYLYKNPTAVGKWASWIVRANEDNLDVGVLHYLSTLKIASGMYRSNITMLFNFFRKNPSALNNESLKLLYPRPYFTMIDDASKGKIDTFLVMGLVRQESAFDARAISHAKAKGLMQIIPQTARRLASQGHKKLLDEKENTKMGVKYLLLLAEKFNGSVELVLAAYNAGPNKVEDWLKRNPDRDKDPLLWNDLIPFMETRDYVVSILRNNYLYVRLYGDKNPQSEKLFSSALVRQLLTDK